MNEEWIDFKNRLRVVEETIANGYKELYALKKLCTHQETVPTRNRHTNTNNSYESTYDLCTVCLAVTNLKTVKTKRKNK
jgi:hypothetical protein